VELITVLCHIWLYTENAKKSKSNRLVHRFEYAPITQWARFQIQLDEVFYTICLIVFIAHITTEVVF